MGAGDPVSRGAAGWIGALGRVAAGVVAAWLAASGVCRAQTFEAFRDFPDGSKSASWYDFDSDGDEDLLILQYQTSFGSAEVRLFTNRNGASFGELPLGGGGVVAASGSGAWGDYNGDGKADVIVGLFDSPPLLRNTGSNLVVATSTGLETAGNSFFASWVDVDLDGDLDAFATPYRGPAPFLFRNDGAGHFDRVTGGGLVTFSNITMANAWCDYDNDGDQDVFIAVSDGGNNGLFVNDGTGGFTAVTSGSVVTDGGNTMSACWGDYDNDGDMDLFVGNAGSQNFLYRNDGGGVLARVTTGVIATDGPADTFGCSWVDCDNDGDLDLFTVNDGPGYLYRNDGGGTFVRITSSPIVNLSRRYTGVAWADFDNDGRMDVFVGANGSFDDWGGGVPRLFRNTTVGNHWLKVRCRGSGVQASVIGAKVRVRAVIGGQPRWQMREIVSQSGYGGGDSQVLHFGLGGATTAAVVRVEWPIGVPEEFTNIGCDQVFTIEHVTLPRVTLHPVATTAVESYAAEFRVEVDSSTPLSYQWRKGGIDILGATQSVLGLNSVVMGDAGTYRVCVSNFYGVVLSSNATLEVLAQDGDADGDGLGNGLEARFGWNFLSLDSDGDSVDDFDEYSVYGTNPGNMDSDGDGIWDDWEVANGLNPTLNDAGEDRDLDGLTNLEEWNLRAQGYLAGNADSNGDGKSDYENFYGKKAERYYYDKIDRLVGAEYNRGSNGLSIAYVYDGNGNILRQVHLKRDGNRDGVPDLRQFLDGVAYSNACAYGDSDGDGWSDYQEWKGGSDAADPNSVPNTLGVSGTSLATFDPGFMPSNFVMGVGQLDGVGGDEIVIGADGNTGGVTNSLLVLSQGTTGWATQRVEVGTFGITSIAVGQIASNSPTAIYFGTRVAGGTGTVWEVRLGGSNGWVKGELGISNALEGAFVCGLRPGAGLAVEVSGTNSTERALKWYSLRTNGWIAGTVDSASGEGPYGRMEGGGSNEVCGARFVSGDTVSCYAPAISEFIGASGFAYRPENQKYYALTPTAMTWSNALAFARGFGGTLASVGTEGENSFILGVGGSTVDRWIGLFRSGGGWAWVNGSPYAYTKWKPGEPNNSGDGEWVAVMGTTGQWNDVADSSLFRGVMEVPFQFGARKVEDIRLPHEEQKITWRGGSPAIGRVRTTNSVSVGCSWIDDMNVNGTVDSGDVFSAREFLVAVGAHSTATVARATLEGTALSGAYGLAFARFLGGSNDVFFTGEPDGRMFSWRAPNLTNAMERTLFSGHYSGKAWHQLAARAEANVGEGLAGLWVDPTNASVCNVAYFAPQRELWTPPVFPQTAPMASVMIATNAQIGIAGVDVRIWDAEGNPSAVAMQFSTNGGASWGPATILTLDGHPYSGSAFVAAQPGGTTHAAVWNARADAGAAFQGTLLLRAQARDMSGAGAWSVAVPYELDCTVVQTADVRVSMSDDPDPVVQGQELTYALSVQNLGPTEAPAATVDVTLPGGVTFVSAVSSQGSCTPSGGSVRCDLGALGNGATATITIEVRPDAAGEIEASAVASHAGADPVSGNNTASATTTVNGSDQLVVSPDPLPIGGVVFGDSRDGVFTLSNTGPSSVSGTASVPAGVFEIRSGTPYDLPGYGSANVVVRFTPSGTGSFSEDVIFTSNGGNQTNRVTGAGADLPAPDFTASPTNGPAPLAVLFTDLTTAGVTNRLWQFGDGSSLATTESNIVYVYNLPGTNTVTLTVQGPGGASSVTKSNLILVVMYPPGDVNGDGRVTGADSLLINQALVPPGLRQTNDAVFAKAGFRNGDVNQDGQVTGADSLRINQVMVQLRSFVVTKILPSWRSNSGPTAVAVYGIGFPTQAVTGVTIGPPVGLSLTNVTPVSREEIRGVVPAGGGTGAGTVGVSAFPSNNVISTGTFENR